MATLYPLLPSYNLSDCSVITKTQDSLYPTVTYSNKSETLKNPHNIPLTSAGIPSGGSIWVGPERGVNLTIVDKAGSSVLSYSFKYSDLITAFGIFKGNTIDTNGYSIISSLSVDMGSESIVCDNVTIEYLESGIINTNTLGSNTANINHLIGNALYTGGPFIFDDRGVVLNPSLPITNISDGDLSAAYKDTINTSKSIAEYLEDQAIIHNIIPQTYRDYIGTITHLQRHTEPSSDGREPRYKGMIEDVYLFPNLIKNIQSRAKGRTIKTIEIDLSIRVTNPQWINNIGIEFVFSNSDLYYDETPMFPPRDLHYLTAYTTDSQYINNITLQNRTPVNISHTYSSVRDFSLKIVMHNPESACPMIYSVIYRHDNLGSPRTTTLIPHKDQVPGLNHLRLTMRDGSWRGMPNSQYTCNVYYIV